MVAGVCALWLLSLYVIHGVPGVVPVALAVLLLGGGLSLWALWRSGSLHQRLAHLESAAARLALIYQNAPVGIALFSAPPELRLLDANDAYLALQEPPYNQRSKALGECFAQILPRFNESEALALFEQAARTGQAVHVREFPYPFFTRGVTYWNTDILPLRDRWGTPEILLVLSDVTEEVRMREELRRLTQLQLQSEWERREFYRQLVTAVSRGKIDLVEEDALRLPGEIIGQVDIRNPEDVADFRHAISHASHKAGLSEAQAFDLSVAASEAATNTLKHAGGGLGQVAITERGVIARVEDQGPGISAERLPRVLFQPGYSTRATLGMGFTLMMELMDRMEFATRPGRTIVQLEKNRTAPAPAAPLDLLLQSADLWQSLDLPGGHPHHPDTEQQTP
ncbi:MAG: ATP-binding protein [Armatimonadetes bacterium]|nr:ATP-binding protein [Armatimonadota bacterium]